jgi:hypothetical protein
MIKNSLCQIKANSVCFALVGTKKIQKKWAKAMPD